MVLIQHGKSELSAHMLAEIGNLTSKSYLYRSTSVAILFLFLKKNLFRLQTCATGSELPSNNSAMAYLYSLGMTKNIFKLHIEIGSSIEGLKYIM